MFTEHIRKELKYAFKDFVADIKNSALKYPDVNYLIGAEAKVLPGGDLDIPDDILNDISLIAFACHGFPDDAQLWFNSFSKLFEDARWKNKYRVYVHPGRFLLKRNWLQQQTPLLEKLIQKAINEGVYIEQNKREMLPPASIILPPSQSIIGFDIHRNEDYQKVLTYFQSL
jgi:putative hydrolase